MDDKISTSAEYAEDAILPQVRVSHTDPNSHVGLVSVPKAVSKKPVKDKSPAEWAYERLILYIQNFEEQLNAEQEIAMGFTGADAGVMRIEGIGFFDPDIVTFYGSDEDGLKAQQIQHVSQLNVILRAMPRVDETAEPMRIGFRLAAGLENK